jgi:hypothetical protein
MDLYYTIRNAREEGLDVENAIKIRIMNLKQEIREIKQHYDTANNAIKAFFVHNQIMDGYKEIEYLERRLVPRQESDELTKEMISRARDYPIEQLIQFTHGKAMAFCHEDKTPSLSKHPSKNYCRCFVCNKTFGPIDVLMEQHGMNFPEAVKALL